MKKEKVKAIAKMAKKQIRKSFRLSLVNQLKELTNKFGQGSTKMSRLIDKGSDQLAKKLDNKIKIDKSIILDVINESEVSSKPKVPVTDRKTKNASGRKPGSVTAKKAQVAPRKPGVKATVAKQDL